MLKPPCFLFFCFFLNSFYLKKYDIRTANVFLINLKNRYDKLLVSKFQLNMLGLNYSIIEAINGNFFAHLKVDDTSNKILQNITGINGLKISLKSLQQSSKSPGQIGCWLSHLKALNSIINSENDSLSLILEDDFIADGNAIELVNKNLEKLSENNEWDLLYVGHCDFKKRCKKYLDPSKTICKTISRIYCTHAYVLKNKSVAKVLFNAGNQATPVIADHYFEKTGLQRYIIFPHIFKQRKSIIGDINSPGGYHTDLLNKTIENLVNTNFPTNNVKS